MTASHLDSVNLLKVFYNAAAVRLLLNGETQNSVVLFFQSFILSLSSVRTICSPGYYSLGGQKQCTQCPEGYMCPNIETGKELCPTGFYSASAAVNCTGCEAGFYCPTTYGMII